MMLVCGDGGDGGDGGCFLACEDLGGKFGDSFPACAFIFLFLVFKDGDQLSYTNSTCFRPGSVNNGSASSDDCGRVLPDVMRVSSFSLISSHTMPAQRYSQPTPTSLGQGRKRV